MGFGAPLQKIQGAFFGAEAPKNRAFRSNSSSPHAGLRDFRCNPLRNQATRSGEASRSRSFVVNYRNPGFPALITGAFSADA
jgi:hypothetical protein